MDWCLSSNGHILGFHYIPIDLRLCLPWDFSGCSWICASFQGVPFKSHRSSMDSRPFASGMPYNPSECQWVCIHFEERQFLLTAFHWASTGLCFCRKGTALRISWGFMDSHPSYKGATLGIPVFFSIICVYFARDTH